jgi:hypothetical protein
MCFLEFVFINFRSILLLVLYAVLSFEFAFDYLPSYPEVGYFAFFSEAEQGQACVWVVDELDPEE